jgi:hypothetical protein
MLLFSRKSFYGKKTFLSRKSFNGHMIKEAEVTRAILHHGYPSTRPKENLTIGRIVTHPFSKQNTEFQGATL